MVCQQQLQIGMRAKQSETHLLWGQCPLSKWNGGKSHLRPIQERTWPQVVSITLWPYALQYAVHLHNNLPVLKDERSRLQLYSSWRKHEDPPYFWVPLVLSLTTGLVSLQFHCCFDAFLKHVSMEILTWASPQCGSILQDLSM